MIVASKHAARHSQSQTQSHHSIGSESTQHQQHMQTEDPPYKRKDAPRARRNHSQLSLQNLSFVSDTRSTPTSDYQTNTHQSGVSHAPHFSNASLNFPSNQFRTCLHQPKTVSAQQAPKQSNSWWLQLFGKPRDKLLPCPEMQRQLSLSLSRAPSQPRHQDQSTGTTAKSAEDALTMGQLSVLQAPQRVEQQVEFPTLRRLGASLRLPAAVFSYEQSQETAEHTCTTPTLSVSHNVQSQYVNMPPPTHRRISIVSTEPSGPGTSQARFGTVKTTNVQGPLANFASSGCVLPADITTATQPRRQKQTSHAPSITSRWSNTSTEDLRLTPGRTTPSFLYTHPIENAQASYHSFSQPRLSEHTVQTEPTELCSSSQHKSPLRTSASERGSLQARSLLLRQQDLCAHKVSVQDNPAPRHHSNKSVSSTKTSLMSRLYSSRHGRASQQLPLLQDRLLLQPVVLTSPKSGQKSNAYLCTLRRQDDLHPFSTFADTAVDPHNVSARKISSVYPAGCSYSSQIHDQIDELSSDLWDGGSEQLALNRYFEMDERPSAEPDKRLRPFDVYKKLAR